ncbi:hypothetical protein [Mobilicoccus pelagius]|uniref:Uncharacterized protein n=1 Tax=Mobilicoccus pelagius NBRC 104925 TaxID=1089455 RepID=H5UVG9_9MICO|nr:hypothetical protein [Mobilicoccus pelagius]GAB49727.1 hypothetical protein MOPEL_134_00110 [Mobilicoccus pelagius NBRC 104925]
MTPTRRLATFALAAALVPALGACGEGGFVDFVKGSGSAGTAAPSPSVPTPTGTDLLTASESPEDSASPSESSGEGTSTDGPSESPTDDTATSGTSSPVTTSATPDESTTSASSASSTASTAPQGGVVQVDGRTIQDVPAGLAFPGGAKIEGTSAFEGGGGSVVLSEPAEAEVFSYYRSALSGAGYRVVSDTAGVLAFTGHGCRGSIVGTGGGAVITWSPTRS